MAEASQALIRLDADRLEELALSCELLNRQMMAGGGPDRAQIAQQASETAAGVRILGKVLDATRSNLKVLHALREIREGQLEYGPARNSNGNN